MSDGFNDMLARATAFFRDLRADNTKAFFEPRKEHYTAEIRKPAELFSEIMAEEISRMTGANFTPKVFRIYRDVRFSKDKTPYNAWLHMIWASGDKDDLAPVFFFGHDPNETIVASGIIGLRGDALTRYRIFVDSWGDLLTDVIDETGGEIADYGADPLKRVPKPYDPDHTHGDLLRRKGLILKRGVTPTHPDGLVTAVRQEVAHLLPFQKLLSDRL